MHIPGLAGDMGGGNRPKSGQMLAPWCSIPTGAEQCGGAEVTFRECVTSFCHLSWGRQCLFGRPFTCPRSQLDSGSVTGLAVTPGLLP